MNEDDIAGIINGNVGVGVAINKIVDYAIKQPTRTASQVRSDLSAIELPPHLYDLHILFSIFRRICALANTLTLSTLSPIQL
jgi:hypothetical protein